VLFFFDIHRHGMQYGDYLRRFTRLYKQTGTLPDAGQGIPHER
jgi:hypothetical protein